MPTGPGGYGDGVPAGLADERPAEADLPPDLVFSLDDEPGIERRGRRRFRYVDQTTLTSIDDVDTLARIRALAIPPAWTEVWIAADPCGHLQATGRDARGRKQYRYHDRFRAHRDEAKFDLLMPFGQSLPRLRRKVADDLALPGLPADKVVALVIQLLEETFVRVGNEEYARSNGSFGLTTLRHRHVHLEGGRLRLRFRAKSAKTHDIVLDDPRLVRLVRRCQGLPGQVLFQYVDDEGAPHPIRSSDVNDYVKDVTGQPSTAKSFRTWGATLLAAVGLGALPAPASAREGRGVVTGMLTVVARALNNTPAVCRRSYVHPGLVESYLAGELADRWRTTSARGSSFLSTDERRLVHFLGDLDPPSG